MLKIKEYKKIRVAYEKNFTDKKAFAIMFLGLFNCKDWTIYVYFVLI